MSKSLAGQEASTDGKARYHGFGTPARRSLPVDAPRRYCSRWSVLVPKLFPADGRSKSTNNNEGKTCLGAHVIDGKFNWAQSGVQESSRLQAPGLIEHALGFRVLGLWFRDLGFEHAWFKMAMTDKHTW